MTGTGAAGLAGDAFGHVLAAAMLGTDRAGPTPGLLPLPAGDAGEPGGVLLARLAISGVRHLAGTGLAASLLHPLPVRAPDGPDCPPAAAERLAGLLSLGPPEEGRVREWCALAARAGVGAPPWLLPALAPLRQSAAALIDPVARPGLDWLARVQAGTAEAVAENAGQDWMTGDVVARADAFTTIRRSDPDTARTALQAIFGTEAAEARMFLVDALHVGLSDADEPFLEACLDDRAAGVRRVARDLLVRLPGSRLARRMGARVETMLAIMEQRRVLLPTRRELLVTLPEDSPALARDVAGPGQTGGHAGGRRASLLRGILAAAPLQALQAHPPLLWVELALATEWSAPIIDGLLDAAERDGDLVWTRALVAGLSAIPPSAGDGGPSPATWARAVSLLPPAEWEQAALDSFGTQPVGAVVQLFHHRSPDTISAGFAEALIGWFGRTICSGQPDREVLARSRALGAAGELCDPTDRTVAAAAALAAELPAGPMDAVGRQLHRQVDDLVETLALRRAMRQDFEKDTVRA